MKSPGTLVLALAVLSGVLTSRPASARSFRVDEIPNGRARSCNTCHETGGGVVFNPFGSDVRSHLVDGTSASTMHVDWGPELAKRDSDGDGVTNGEELGDPDGTWRIGDPDPATPTSAPGDPDNAAGPAACGDGRLSAAETCDSDQLRGATCESENLGHGEMLCGLDCHLDTSNCDGSLPDEDDGGGTTQPADGCAVAPGGSAKPSVGLGAVGVAAMGGAAALAVARRRKRGKTGRKPL